MVDELRSVVRVEHEKRKREHALQGGDGLDDPLRRVVADRRVLGPPGDQVGHRQSPRELALERWPAVRDGVRLDHPGVVAGSSPTLLNPIELRSNGDSLVVLMPRSCIDLRAGAIYRSIVAALIACNCVTASTVANGLSRSPASASRGSHRPRITTRYFPHGQPINAHTCSNSDRESSLYSFGCSFRLSTCSAGSGNA